MIYEASVPLLGLFTWATPPCGAFVSLFNNAKNTKNNSED